MSEFAQQAATEGDLLSAEFMSGLQRRLESDDQANYRLAIQKLADDGLIRSAASGISITAAGITYLKTLDRESGY